MGLLDQLDWREWLPALRVAGHVVMIVVLAWIMVAVSRRGTRTIRTYMRGRTDSAEHAKRVDTIARVFRHVSVVLVTLIAGMLILSELGLSIAPILGAAGVVGVAVGFGAQSLVKDFFSGFFILLENQVRVGDVVEVGGKGGLVEEVTLRYVRLRDYDGNVHFVPNGMIEVVTNSTLDFAYSVVDAGVAYREDVDEALRVMQEVAEQMRQDPVFGLKIREPVEVVGVERWDDSAVVLRVRFKVMPIEQWNVRREYLKRLKRAFDAAGIEIPYPHLTLYPGRNKDGSAPPLNFAPVGPLRVTADGGASASAAG
ncbi:MAG TPA: mechanosensitive ion channel family protein [Burkholderiales bacterium]|nr:mechanosensitive ion channel family protein [Burkholderiales bacterium]